LAGPPIATRGKEDAQGREEEVKRMYYNEECKLVKEDEASMDNAPIILYIIGRTPIRYDTIRLFS
jgi:hypothetical protein